MITTALSYIDSMTAPNDNLRPSGRQLALVGASSADQLPAIFLRSESAGRRFWELFTGNIRNRNTRRALLRRGLAVFQMVRAEKTSPRGHSAHPRGCIYRA